MKRAVLTHLSVLVLSAGCITGCAVATAGVVKGDERSFVRSLNDVNAGRAIEARMKRAYGFDLNGIDVEVAEGVVVLSGNAPTKEDRIEASRIAWSAPRIDQVGNEVMIKDKQGLIRNTKDGILEKSVRTRLLADKYVKGRNFNVETHDGIVYLLGVARNQAELERAARIASLTRGTQEVISYVRVADLAVGASPEPSQRDLPDFISDAPLPQDDATDLPAPMRAAPFDQPIQRVEPGPAQPPAAYGDVVIPDDPTAEPFYIDPDTGEQIPVRFVNGKPTR